MLERVDDVSRRERPETVHVHAARLDPLFLAEPVDRRLGRFHVAAHAHQDVFRVGAAVRADEAVFTPGFAIELLERVLQGRFALIVVPTLGDLALHVRILILHDARHHRVGRVHQIHELVLRIADKFPHELGLDQPHAFHGVRRQEAVLHVHERRGRRLGRPPRDQAQVARLLRIAGKQNPPAAIGDAHHVIMPGVYVEPLARECPGADVEHGRQPLAGDRVQHFLHQHEALAGREIRHPSAGRREALAERRRRMLALRLDEHELVAPQIGHAVDDGLIEAAAHRRGAGDRKRAAALRDVRLDPHDGFGAVARGRDAGILKLLGTLGSNQRNIGRPINRFGSHTASPMCLPKCESLPGRASQPPDLRLAKAGMPYSW